MSVKSWSQILVQKLPMPLSHSTLLPPIKLQQKERFLEICFRLAFRKTRFTWIFFRVFEEQSNTVRLIVGALNSFTIEGMCDTLLRGAARAPALERRSPKA